MMRCVRRFSPGKTSLTAAVLYGLMGLLVIPCFYVMLRIAPIPTYGRAGVGSGARFILLLPLFYAVLGYVTTYIGCLLYNWVAGFTGGIEVEVTDAPPGASA